MAIEEQKCLDNDSVILSRELTEQILAEIGAKTGVADPQGFLQVVIFRPEGNTLLGIDGRAEYDNSQEERKSKILKVHTMATIFSRGSCVATIVMNKALVEVILPDALCPHTTIE